MKICSLSAIWFWIISPRFTGNHDTTCSSYLSLHNRSPWNLWAENNKHLLLHSFFRMRFWKWLSWVALAQGVSQGCKPDVHQGCRHPKAQVGLEGSLLSSCMRLLAGGPLSSWSHWASPHDMEACFPQNKWSKRQTDQDRGHYAFWWPRLQSHTWSLLLNFIC